MLKTDSQPPSDVDELKTDITEGGRMD